MEARGPEANGADEGRAERAAANRAVQALAALAQEHRLAVFRLLIREGPPGLPAGAVAASVGVPPSTLSHHLAVLEGAGLITSQRVERRIYYGIDIAGTRRLLAFLTEDCCRGRPELCGFRKETCADDDHHLPQPEVRDVAQRAGDDPQFR
jgi:ArsR family transcriptional regulator, arsenate/arsenite/antimonite-responsive transcriptional repressor